MTYKLEPWLDRITSPVLLIFPDHTFRYFSSGKELCSTVFDKKWRVVEMKAAGDTIEIRLAPIPDFDGDETFF